MQSALVALPYLKDFFTIISLIMGSYIAWEGLKTWQKQLKGTTEYNLARNILKTIYEIRDAIYRVRRRIDNLRTLDSILKKANKNVSIHDNEYYAKATESVFWSKWEKVSELHQNLEIYAIEAETLWGKSAKDTILTINGSVKKLFDAYNAYIRYLYQKNLDKETAMQLREICFNFADNEKNDKFTQELLATIKSIEKSMHHHFPN